MVWDLFDFAFAGVLVLGAGVTYALAARKTDNTAYRSAVAVALATAFILVWVNAAVGVIGTAHDDANLMYGGVLAVGIIGAIIARFQPRGMARALIATALAQALVLAIALVAGLGRSTDSIWPVDILISNGFFAALWLTSSRLFRNAAREQLPGGAEPKGRPARLRSGA